MKSMVIVESPAKAKTINKILGKDYEVFASIGHVKDLPENELGVDVKNGFKPRYVIIPGKEKILEELKKNAKNKKIIYLATDPDREGEAIAWHIAEELKNGKEIRRVVFHEITEKAVKEAFKNSGDIDMNKVYAQQARRILDRLVGYGLSPLLWKKVKRGLSAGRVQSVAVRLIVDREREIQSFQKEEYWTIEGIFISEIGDKEKRLENVRLYRYRDKLIIERDSDGNTSFLIRNEEEVRRIIEELNSKRFYLSDIERKKKKRSPLPPFITSTLQQEAYKKLGFTAKKTMMLAQQLYEGVEIGGEPVGLITYMRTDSVRISVDAQKWAREIIEKKYGKNYLPERPPVYKSKSLAQEAHEAIRPTYPDKLPEKVKPFLSKDQYMLYNLIWQRFIASQMAPAMIEQTTYVIKDADNISEFRVTGSVIKFLGFMIIYKDDQEDDGDSLILPELDKDIPLTIGKLIPHQHYTQPPPRYTEATLVKTLEEKGIGRPSTYATIISNIQERKYVVKEDGKFVSTELGTLVNDLLVERFPELIDVSFTAKMEDKLDKIELSKVKWVELLKEFYGPFDKDLKEAMKVLKRIRPEDIPTDILCEKCGLPMVIRWGKHGRFIACTGYPRCKNTLPLEENGENGKRKEDLEVTAELCPNCGSLMVIKKGKFGKFLACSKYPECKTTKPISTGVKCPLDGGDLIERKTRKGRTFWSCSNYPDCKFAIWQRPVNEECPSCGAPFLVIKSQGKRLYLSCIEKNCEYKKPLEKEKVTVELSDALT